MSYEQAEHPSVNSGKEYSIENDPLFKPINEEKKKKIDEAVEKKIRSLTIDENVDTDYTTVPGQKYALISVVSPQSNQKSDNLCLKIRGAFNSLEEANKQAEMLQKLDTTFDIYVVEMYSWLLLPPDPNMMEQKHIDNKLNEIIGGHRESQLKSKMYFEERKRELMENIEVENERRKEENEKQENENSSCAIEDITIEKNENTENTETVPQGISAETSVDITENIPDGKNCPTSGPNSEEQSATPSELMDAMINQKDIRQ
jgi:hypothetical protein